jgi:hypothetical protein
MLMQTSMFDGFRRLWQKQEKSKVGGSSTMIVIYNITPLK